MTVLLHVLLAAAFATAAVGKARAPREAAAYLRPLVGRYDRAAARLLGLAEAVLAAAFVVALGVDEAGRLAGVAAVVFLVAATGAHAMLLAAGRPPQCHCFGAFDRRDWPREPAWESALFATRNAFLTATSAAAADLTPQIAASAGGAVAIVVAAGLIASVVRERSRLRRDPHPLKGVYAPQIADLVVQTWWVDGHPRRM